MDTLIKLIEQQQIEYSKKQNRKYLKDNSQFFTPYDIALKMIKTINLKKYCHNQELYILEPAAGFGILIASLINSIVNQNDVTIKKIIVDAYEIEKKISTTLESNLSLLKYILKDNYNIDLEYSVINKNFILINENEWKAKDNISKYDIIISNPPFDKINQTSEEAKVMKDIIYGQPNIYSLFIAMSLKLLNSNGTYVVLSPRNYLNGTYSIKLRKFIFENYSLTHLHSFDNRNIFKFVNQEIIISTYINNHNYNEIKISHNGKFELTTSIENIIYDKNTFSIFVPNSEYSITILSKFKKLKFYLTDLNIKVSVGPIVQFRNKAFLSKNIYSDNFAPLLIANDIQENNTILYYNRENNPKRITHNKSISIKAKYLLPNSNYLLLRKVTAKDDKTTIVVSVLEKNFLDHDFVGLDNNLLYFHKLNKSESLTLEECYGLFCFINSGYFEEYYSLINGTHTINVSDFNNIKFPDLNTIKFIGNKIMELNKFDKDTCSYILDEFIFNK